MSLKKKLYRHGLGGTGALGCAKAHDGGAFELGVGVSGALE